MVHLERFESLYTHTPTHAFNVTETNILSFTSLLDRHTHTISNLAASIIVCVCQRDRADSRVSDTPPPRWLFPVASCPLPVYCSGMFYYAGPVNHPKHLTLHVCTINRCSLAEFVEQIQWTMRYGYWYAMSRTWRCSLLLVTAAKTS